MRIKLDNLQIELENQQEIVHFWNIISFALDLQAERDKAGIVCMTEEEKALALKLQAISNIY